MTLVDETHTLTRATDDAGRVTELCFDGDTGVALRFAWTGDSRAGTVSNAHFAVAYAYADDLSEWGQTLTTVDGLNVTRVVARDRFQPARVLAVSNLVNGILVAAWDFEHDARGRITSRNADTFTYNVRSELTDATISGNTYQYSFDSVGNSIWTSCNAATNTYTANNLNQYESVLRGFAASRFYQYDADGNLTSDGVLTYAYDCENRLSSVTSNDTLLASYAYDYQGRRVRKMTPSGEHRYFYDDWNLVHETVIAEAVTNQIDYFWGRDLSGGLTGAGGVGGLLAVSIDGAFYFPLYDHNGNITDYVSSSGAVVAHYEYDAFGNTISQTGSLADTFRHRFSTKYFDPETGFYYYGYRYYVPSLHRWLTPDPIEEEGGLNLYGFCGNSPLNLIDICGQMPSLTWTHISRVENGSLDDALKAFLTGKGPLYFYYYYPNPETLKLLGHREIKKYLNEFRQIKCRGTGRFRQESEIKYTATLSDFFNDLTSFWGYKTSGEQRGFGVQVIGSFTGHVETEVDCTKCTRHLIINVYNVFTVESLTRLPWRRNVSLISSSETLKPVYTIFNIDIVEDAK